MTQADSAHALRMSLDSRPTHGQEQAAEITAVTPLPHGWASFCSKPHRERGQHVPGHWYATAPWHVDSVRRRHDSEATRGLQQTVSAPTWPALHAEVAKQVELYERLAAAGGAE